MRSQEAVALARRVREARLQRDGDRGLPDMARAMGVPLRTWVNYESGVTIPALVVLRFMRHTGATAEWLLVGQPEGASGGGLRLVGQQPTETPPALP